jgi:hypothetical protein
MRRILGKEAVAVRNKIFFSHNKTASAGLSATETISRVRACECDDGGVLALPLLARQSSAAAGN